MKLLLIGNPNSAWIINFIQNYLILNDVKITVFTDIKLEKRNISFYYDNNINLIECLHKGIFFQSKHTKLGFWTNLLKQAIKQKRLERFDLINIQYVDLTLLIWAVLIVKFPQKIIISYWGSDLLRKKKYVLKLAAPFVKKVGKYTFDNIDLYNFFVDMYGGELKKRSYIALFGLSILEIMKKQLEISGRENIRYKYNIKKTDIVVAIGYNGKEEQQHIKVLKEICKIDSQLKQNIIILIQMTYGGNEKYRNTVKEIAKRTGCRINIYENFLSDYGVAELRCITDIYINSQTTDAFSGSVCEYLYGEACLINARWLKYAEFDKYPFRFWEFADFADLPTIIDEIVRNRNKINNKINKKLIWKLRSWDNCREIWDKALGFDE